MKKSPMLRLATVILVLCVVSLSAGCNGDRGSAESNTEESDSGATTYTISGTISGSVSTGVTVSLIAGTSSSTTTTDSSGAFSFTGVSAGTYTLTPTLSGYSFSPTSTAVTISTADVANISFASSISTLGDRTDYSSVTLDSDGTYAKSVTEDEDEYVEYTSTTADTPAIKVSPGGSLTLTHCKATKSGGTTSSTEASGFYGFNSGVLASSSSATNSYTSSSDSAITMTDCTITTSVAGANGAFAFGENASITLDHVTINTTGSSNSRGVDATYGGSVTITNSKISTTGGSCAALATDRYTGTSAPSVTATNVEGTTAGTGSPGIYCTGTFTVTGCTLTATGSEAAVIEGKNSITLNNSSLSGAKKWGVMIYQSTSGDSSEGTGTFSMTGGALTNTFSDGPLFFVCDTTAVINLNAASLVNSSDMLLVAGKASTACDYIDDVNSSWGSLGGTVTFTATDQTLEGDIIVCDSSSSLDMTLTTSAYSGAINTDNNGGTINLTIDADSTWTVTGTSYIKSLTNHGTINGSGTLYVNGSIYHY